MPSSDINNRMSITMPRRWRPEATSMRVITMTLSLAMLSANLSPVASAVVSNELNEMQLLSNEKPLAAFGQYLHSPNSNPRDQQQQSQSPVIANDLLADPQHQLKQQQQPEAGEIHKSDISGYRQQQQQAASRPAKSAVVSSNAVINGNHATYVEPPANFKPIIYDYQQQQQNQHRHQQQQVAAASEISAESQHQNQEANRLNNNNQHQRHAQVDANDADAAVASTDPLAIHINSDQFHQQPPSQQQQQQQHHRQQHQQVAADSNDGHELGADKMGGQIMQFKPSIGRWSDWHDMSIEPDLASSDSQEMASYVYSYSPPLPRFAVPPAPFRIRNKRVEVSAPASNEVLVATDLEPTGTKRRSAVVAPQQQQQQPLASSFGGQSDDQSQPPMTSTAAVKSAAISGKQINQMSVKRPVQQEQPQVSGATQQVVQAPQKAEIATVPQQQHQQQPQQLQQVVAMKSTATASASAASGPIKGLGHNNKLAVNQIVSSPNNLMKSPPMMRSDDNIHGLQVVGLDSPSASFSAGKGAPVSELTPAQAQKWPPANLQRRLKRRRKSKANAEVRIQQLVAASQQQQQLQQQHLIQSAAGKQATGQGLGGQQQQQRQQVDHGHAQPQQRSLERVPARQAPGHPQVIMRKLGAQYPAASLAPDAAAALKKTVKKRRIKTQLPVGLSSWFLGGIRDLDGRHWQLPADVISRLAVNDVDLVHPTGEPAPAKVEPPSPGSVVMIGASGEQQQAAASTQSPAQRVPISQLIPR